MCGFFGYINFNSNNLDKDRFVKCGNQLSSRGPDDEGFWNDDNCYLFHKRLSIIDLSSNSKQPFISDNGRYICVYNGEIYNYKLLKEELENEGVIFKSSGDTEVLLNGWIQWGEKVLDKIDGMFSFAIWDKLKKKIFLARDPFGEKPLYYYYNNNEFIFSSRPNPILALFPQIRKKIDYRSINIYLELGYIPSPYSLYLDLYKLEPGHYISKSELKFDKVKYWTLPKTNSIKKNDINLNDAINKTEILIRKSVENRLVSDVEVGCFLSGGVDSSLISFYTSEILGKNLKTFSLGFKEKAQDETYYSDFVSGLIKSNHNSIKMDSDDLLKYNSIFFENFDEPFADPSAFPTLALSGYASKKVKVVLTGDGSDEIFGGYHYYKIINILKFIYKIPTFLIRVINILISNIPHHNIILLSRLLEKNNLLEAFQFIRSFKKDFLYQKDNGIIESLKVFEKYIEENNLNKNQIDLGMCIDQRFTLSDCYLQKVDVSSMAYSLEARSPFLNKEIISFINSLPQNLKNNFTNTKILLKNIALKYFPKKIILRKKQGFEIPLQRWINSDLSHLIVDTLKSSEILDLLNLDGDKIKKLAADNKSKRNCSSALWSIIILVHYIKKNH